MTPRVARLLRMRAFSEPMLRYIASFLAAFAFLASPAAAKDELAIGTTQAPGTMNPLISSMLAKSLILNMTQRPVTAYDANWNLVCLLCTELPTIENGKARLVDLPDGKKGIETDYELKPFVWGDGTPLTTKDIAFTIN